MTYYNYKGTSLDRVPTTSAKCNGCYFHKEGQDCPVQFSHKFRCVEDAPNSEYYNFYHFKEIK